jgi:hypothetical protein
MKYSKLQKIARRPVFIVGCILLMACLVIGADRYRAHASLITPKEAVVADNRKIVDRNSLGLMSGGDTCSSATAIGALPFNDSGTTVGMTDDYDLPTAISAPTVTGCPTCTATGGGPPDAAPRGGVFLGTGTGPDVAYSITFSSSNNSLDVTVTPTGSQDLALIVYTDVCSNNLSDAIVVDDDNSDGEAEHVVISNMPAGTYNILVDAYSTGGTPPGVSGPYSIAITGSGTISGGATPTATPTPSGDTISGTITYGNAAVPPKYISNATVNGAGSPNVSTTTAAPGATAGQYTLSGFGSGSYTVSVSKSSGQNGITSNDAARVAQHVSGAALLTTDAQKVSADVSNNNNISSFDAAQIATYVVTGTSAGIAGQWRFFVPPGPTFPVASSATTRTYSSVTGSITGQDFVGLLMGEVSGNWAPSAARIAVGAERSVSVMLPDILARTGDEMVIPVRVSGASSKNIISFEFDLQYDPAVLQPVTEPVDVTATASRGLSVAANPAEPGLLKVALYGAEPIDGNALLLNLRFRTIGKVGAASPLTWQRIMFNEGDPQVNAGNGKVELVSDKTKRKVTFRR